LEFVNSELDPAQRRFRNALTFDIVPKPGISNPFLGEHFTAVTNSEGRYAVFEFSGALPRASLYSEWQTCPDDQTALEILVSPAFDPQKTVLVNGALPSPAGKPNNSAGSVTFAGYQPNHFVLKAYARAASVLLLNDRYDPDWKVWVDGKPETVLRCNYNMRGVFLAPGLHQVEFRFRPSMGPSFVSLAVIAVGLGLVAVLYGTRAAR
jgi:hypothetical protein